MGFLRTAMLVGVVGSLFGGLGCAAPAPMPVKVQKKYDAVTVFRAVYFDEGPATSVVRGWKLPRKDAVVAKSKKPQPAIAAEQLRDLAKQYDGAKLKLTATNLRQLADTIEKTNAAPRKLSTKQHDATVKLIIGRIRSADSKFFTRFGQNVRSGSHVKVEKILKEGLARITAAACELPKNTTAREFEGGYDDFGGFDDGGGYEGGGYEGGGYEGGGYEDTGGDGYDNGGYDNGGYDNGGYDNGGYDNGGADNGGYDNGGYDNGGADNGGYDNGGADNGGANGGAEPSGGTDTGGTDTGNSADNGAGTGADTGAGADTGGDTGAVGDQAALQVNVTVWYDTAVAIDKVAAGYATLFWGATEDGSIQTATFVNHITTSLE